MTTHLTSLIEQGNLDELQILLKKEADAGKVFNTTWENEYESGLTILHWAALKRQAHIITWLMSENGGRSMGFSRQNVLAKVKRGQTALHFAVFKGDLPCVEALVHNCREDEREELMNAIDTDKKIAFHFVSTPEVAAWFLSDSGGRAVMTFEQMTAITSWGRNAWHEAARIDNLDLFKALIFGCKVENGEREEMLNCCDRMGGTVMYNAAESGNASVVAWLLSSEGRGIGFNSVLSKDTEGRNILHAAAKGNLATLLAVMEGTTAEERKQLVDDKCEDEWTALHFAATGIQEPEVVIDWLLSSEGGRAAGFHHSVLDRTLGVDLNAFHVAARHGHVDAAKALLKCSTPSERKEMLNAVDNLGWNVLHCVMYFKYTEFVSWLLLEGGREGGLSLETIIRPNARGETALDLAISSSEFEPFQALLAGLTSEERAILFLAQDKRHGWTVLHRAALRGELDVIRELVSLPEAEMMMDVRDNRGMTALHRMLVGGVDEASKKEWRINAYLSRAEVNSIIKCLLGADPNVGVGKKMEGEWEEGEEEEDD